MSLLLRSICQPVLDVAGLQSFHIRVNDHSHTMTIVGECGQPFVSISGIQFARTVPSQAELPLAVELLDAFLMKHKPEFDLYVKELAKYSAITPVSEDTDQYILDTVGYGDELKYYVTVTSGCFKVSIFEDGTIHTINLSGSNPKFSMAALAKGPNLKHLQDAQTHLRAFLIYDRAGQTVKDMKSALSSCEI